MVRQTLSTTVTFILAAASHSAIAQRQELILPIVVNGFVSDPVHFQTTFRMLNTSNSALNITFEARQSDGAPIKLFQQLFCDLNPFVSPPVTETVLKIPANGSLEWSTKGEGVGIFNGWVRLSYEAPSPEVAQSSTEAYLVSAKPLTCPIVVCNRTSRDFIATAQVSPVKPAKEFSVVAIRTANRESAYAIVNPSPTTTAKVSVSILTASGENFAKSSLSIPPLNRMGKFLSELYAFCDICGVLPAFPNMFHGSVKITSDSAIAVGALNVLFPEGKWVNLAVSSP